MSSPVFQGAGTVVTNATGAALSVPWPTHAAGDIGILVTEGAGDSAVKTAPTGWSQLADLRDIKTAAGSRLRAYWKRAASSSEPNVTTYVTLDHQIGRIVTFRGCIATGSPVDDVAADVKGTESVGGAQAASTTATMPSVDTTVVDDLIVFICGRPDDSASTTHFGTPVNAALTGIDPGVEAGSTDGHGGGFVVAWGTKPTIGSTGTTTLSKTASTIDTRITVALKPVPVVVPPPPPDPDPPDPEPDPDPDPDVPGPVIPTPIPGGSGKRLAFGVGPSSGHAPSQPVTQFTSMTITRNWLTGPQVTMTIASNSPAAKQINGLASDLWVYKNGLSAPWMRLRILPVQQGWPSDGVGDVTITAVGYKQVVSARHIRSGPPTFSATDQGDIGWALIAHTQAQVAGDLGITKGTTLTGQVRDRKEYQIGAEIGSLMTDLGKVINGMAWEITAERVYNARLLTAFPVRTDPIVHGQNARTADRSPGAGFANAAGSVGATNATSPKWVESTGLASDPRGLWEAWDASHTNVIDQTTVEEYANGLLAERIHPPGLWTIELDAAWFFEKGSDYSEGDQVLITVPADIVDVSTAATRQVTAQITELSLTVADTGVTSVKIAAAELSSIEGGGVDPDPPTPDPPTLLSAPVLSVSGGVWTVALQWNTTNGGWVNASSFAYQWQQATTPTGPWSNASASAPGGSAVTAVYAPPTADAGKYYSALVTATGPGGSLSARSNVQQSSAAPAPITTLVPPDGYAWWTCHPAQDGTNGTVNTAGYTTWRGFARRYADGIHFYVSSAGGWDGTIPAAWQALCEANPDGTSFLIVNWKIASNMSRAAVAAGGNDAIFDEWADNIVDWPHRLIVCLDHEFDNNGSSTGNTPADYANSFRHFVLRARANGVTNVEYCWCVTGYSGQAGNPNGLKYNQMWPGDDVVDWVGLDPYWDAVSKLDYARGGTATAPRNLLNENYNTQGGLWRGTVNWAMTPKTIGVNGLAYAFGGHKPIALMEWANMWPYASDAGMSDTNAAARYRSIGDQFADNVQVKLFSHYNNRNPTHDHRVQGHPLTEDAMGDIGALSQFNYGIDNAP